MVRFTKENSNLVTRRQYLLTITLLKEHEEGRWQSENLEVLPEEINKNHVLWVDAQDPIDTEMKELKDY